MQRNFILFNLFFIEMDNKNGVGDNVEWTASFNQNANNSDKAAEVR